MRDSEGSHLSRLRFCDLGLPVGHSETQIYKALIRSPPKVAPTGFVWAHTPREGCHHGEL